MVLEVQEILGRVSEVNPGAVYAIGYRGFEARPRPACADAALIAST